MRDQYVGDVSDAIKFGFLRALAGSNRTLGVAWYYAPGHDGGPNGAHLEWQDEPAWWSLDAKLHAGLATLPERSIVALEQAPIWPRGTLFHREPMPSLAKRSQWCENKRAALEGADIVFLDPDNGLGKPTEKHATLDEVCSLRRPGRSVAFITFPHRLSKHSIQVAELHARLATKGIKAAITLRTNISVPANKNPSMKVQRPRWLTIIDPDGELASRTEMFAAALRSVPYVTVWLDRFQGQTQPANARRIATSSQELSIGDPEPELTVYEKAVEVASALPPMIKLVRPPALNTLVSLLELQDLGKELPDPQAVACLGHLWSHIRHGATGETVARAWEAYKSQNPRTAITRAPISMTDWLFRFPAYVMRNILGRA